MGTQSTWGHYSSGSQWVVTTVIMIRILAITSLAFLVSADADADAYYALHAPALVPALLNSYPNWPGVSTPFSSSTCYGCRGKRSAEPGYGLVHHFVPLPLEPTMLFTRDTLGLLDPTRASQGESDLQILDMLFLSTMSLMFFLLSQLYLDMASIKLIHLGPLTNMLRGLKAMLLENRIESVYEVEI